MNKEKEIQQIDEAFKELEERDGRKRDPLRYADQLEAQIYADQKNSPPRDEQLKPSVAGQPGIIINAKKVGGKEGLLEWARAYREAGNEHGAQECERAAAQMEGTSQTVDLRDPKNPKLVE